MGQCLALQFLLEQHYTRLGPGEKPVHPGKAWMLVQKILRQPVGKTVVLMGSLMMGHKLDYHLELGYGFWKILTDKSCSPRKNFTPYL